MASDRDRSANGGRPRRAGVCLALACLGGATTACATAGTEHPAADAAPAPADAGAAAPEGDAAPAAQRFTFTTGLDLWIVSHGDKDYDEAMWVADVGNPDGSVMLDGSDLGTPDGLPNSWVSRRVTLPASARRLTFDTRANDDGALRVRVLDEGHAGAVLLGWEVLAGATWEARVADLTPYAGQTVTVVFEQGDNDVGTGEHRYVDNIVIE